MLLKCMSVSRRFEQLRTEDLKAVMFFFGPITDGEFVCSLV